MRLHTLAAARRCFMRSRNSALNAFAFLLAHLIEEAKRFFDAAP